MNEILYKITAIFVFLFIFNCSTFAIQDKSVDLPSEEMEIQQIVTHINFDDVLKKAQAHSYDIKIADYDVLIAKQGVTGARADYFPKLYFGATTEYNKNFQDNLLGMSQYVGDVFINPYTRFQSVLGITLAYNVFDFGVRRGYLDIAKGDIELKKKLEKQKFQELNLNLIDNYSKILMLKKQIDMNNQILELSKKNLQMKERLYKAREISKSELNEQKVQVEKTEKKINELKAYYAESLNLLSFYTGEIYDTDKLVVDDFDTPKIKTDEPIDFTKSLVWDIQESLIDKKCQELKITKRTNLPKLNLYSRYYMYASNPDNYGRALGIEPSNLSVGATLNFPIFDGLKNYSDIKKAKLELEKVYVEKDKAMAEYKNRLDTLNTNHIYLSKQIDNNKTIIKELSEKDISTKRLLANKIVSPVDANQIKIDLLNEQIEYEKNKVTDIAILKGYETLTTYNKEENGQRNKK